jgi:hypothetical protein
MRKPRVGCCLTRRFLTPVTLLFLQYHKYSALVKVFPFIREKYVRTAGYIPLQIYGSDRSMVLVSLLTDG